MKKVSTKNSGVQEATTQPDVPQLALQWHGDAPPHPPKWLIRNRLPETGAGLLIGQWGMLKTFAMLDISVHVMLGLKWTGEPTYRRAGVLCLAKEGSNSISMRLAAITRHKIKSDKRLPFAWTDSCPMLLGKEDPLPILVNAAEQAHARFMQQHRLPLGMIWIDTMSSSAGWTDESDAAEAAHVMGILRDLSKQTGAVVAGVDHLGKNIEAGARGSSVKEANSDFVLALLGKKELSGETSDTRLALRKVREGENGLEFAVIPKKVDMGKDEHGYPITSIVLDWGTEPEPKHSDKDRRTHGEHVLEQAVGQALIKHGESLKLPNGQEVRVVPEKHARAIFKAGYKPEASDKVRTQAFRRAIRGGWVRSVMLAGNEYLWI